MCTTDERITLHMFEQERQIELQKADMSTEFDQINHEMKQAAADAAEVGYAYTRHMHTHGMLCIHIVDAAEVAYAYTWHGHHPQP